MDAVNFSESDFYLQQQVEDRRWTLALVLAVVVHISTFAGAMYLPSFLERKPLLEEVITVNLVSMPEEAAPPPEPVVEPPQPVERNEVEPPPPEAVPIEPEISPPPPEPVVAAKPISLKPVKRKVKKAKDTRLAEEKERVRRAEELKRQARQKQEAERRERERQRIIAQAKREQQRAEDAARRAREELASALRERQVSSSSQRPSARSSGGKQVESIVMQNYYASLIQRLQSFWLLPEMRRWDTNLVAVVIITIDRNGRVINTGFEQKSKDPFYDQFVIKSINSAAPLPRFPKLIKDSQMEVGLTYKPGQLMM